MIHRIVGAALRQRFLVLMLTVFITVGGVLSFQRMPVDAYPDLSPPQVEIITQWPDHAAEEVERLVTLPLEIEMNGVPHMVVMRSISLYGLSDIKLTFEEALTTISLARLCLNGCRWRRCPLESLLRWHHCSAR